MLEDNEKSLCCAAQRLKPTSSEGPVASGFVALPDEILIRTVDLTRTNKIAS